jgi:D-alanyl-D-alanine carboxypeptidase-like protein
MTGPASRSFRRSRRRHQAIILAGLLIVSCGEAQGADVDRAMAAVALAAAYPDFIAEARSDAVVLRDGSVMPLGKVRSTDLLPAIMAAPSLAEQFIYLYPLAAEPPTGVPTEDPGRIRNEAFFKKMYGDCRRGEAQKKMRNVTWLPKTAPQTLRVTTANGIHLAVERLSHEIEKMPLATRLMAVRPAGAFACRTISGTNRPSMHSYGAAIDLNPRLGRYWRWHGLSRTARDFDRIPKALVEAFERHGFIWGGRWLHFDSMHFEYRPEIIEYARRLVEARKRGNAPDR